MAAQRLELFLLGRPQIWVSGRPLSELPPVKGQALLFYLACTRKTLTREALAGLFWGEMDEETARTNLRLTLSRLQKLVGPCVIADRREVRCDFERPIWVDVHEFETSLAAATQPSSTAAGAALKLYRNEFLYDFPVADAPGYELWVLAERERLGRMALNGWQALLWSELDAGQHLDAINTCRRMLDLEPWHEETHRLLMWLLNATGQRNDALTQYASCCRILGQALGVPPAEETTALYEQIKQRRAAGTPHRTQPHSVTRQPLEGPVDMLSSFTTFGALLHYLRRSERMTQRELAIAVGYSESMISRLEHDERPPDAATIMALFVPALHLTGQPQVVAKLVKLAGEAPRKDTEDSQPLPAKSKSPFSLQHPLPVRLTSFVGREDDVLAVARLLARVRLVTLTGPGGCGKTSLAVETCRWLADLESRGLAYIGRAKTTDFDTLALVELYPLSNASLIAQAVLVALGVESNYEQGPQQVLLNAVADRSVLLVLDNCEHFVDDVAHFVQVLLAAVP